MELWQANSFSEPISEPIMGSVRITLNDSASPACEETGRVVFISRFCSVRYYPGSNPTPSAALRNLFLWIHRLWLVENLQSFYLLRKALCEPVRENSIPDKRFCPIHRFSRFSLNSPEPFDASRAVTTPVGSTTSMSCPKRYATFVASSV